MNLLSVESLSKSYGDRILFNDISFGLQEGDKAALIASNGSGKTTLLNILTGKDVPDSGRVVFRSGIRTAYLSQDPGFDKHLSVSDLVFNASGEVLTAIREYEAALHAQAEDFSSSNQQRFENASRKMDALNAWDHEHKINTILSRLEVNIPDQKISTMSGGQIKRLALALVLLDEPDLLILDEPTNHLDLEMIEWLEKYLKQQSLTLLMVTHDRYFLDRVCTHIMEMEDRKIYVHNGNYQFYLQKKSEREEAEASELGKDRQLLRKELEWMRRMPKARTTKSKSRIDSFHALKEKTAGKGRQDDLKLEVKMSRLGSKILEMEHVSKAYGDKVVLDDFSYVFRKGERIGIVGKNGVGKTSFLNLITGKEKQDSGEITTGETVVYGYYTQAGLKLPDDKRVIDVVKDIAEVITVADGSTITASRFLQHFMFPPPVQYTQVGKLSGGERRRLHLMTVLLKNPNFLILDEPTNDLDIITLGKLEDFLAGYGGCLVIVSHDRYFMDKVVDQLFIFEGDGIINGFSGTYTEYRLSEPEENSAPAAPAVKQEPVVEPPAENQKEKLSYKEQKEYSSLEKEIEELEREKAGIEKELSGSDLSYQEIEERTHRIGELIAKIELLTFRWLELAEKI